MNFGEVFTAAFRFCAPDRTLDFPPLMSGTMTLAIRRNGDAALQIPS
jgi:hypothetical protein